MGITADTRAYRQKPARLSQDFFGKGARPFKRTCIDAGTYKDTMGPAENEIEDQAGCRKGNGRACREDRTAL